MTDEIRRAMDARLSALDGSETRRARIRARIAQESKEEEPKVKRKLSVGLVLAVALLLAFGGIAVAEIAGFNVFAFFAHGEHTEMVHLSEMEQQILASIQEKGTLISTSYTSLRDDVPEGYIEIQDAYYDGDVLFITEIISDPRCFAVEWTPTEEELQSMRGEDWTETANARTRILFAHHDGEAAVYDAYSEAIQEWRPFGIKEYTFVGEGDPYVTGEGNLLRDVGLSQNEWINGEATYSVGEMQSPLPEEVRQKGTIEIQRPVVFRIDYYWFDGARLYEKSEKFDAGVITVTLGRDPEASQRRYQAEPVELGGVTVQAEATASPYLAHVILRAEEPIFPLVLDDEGRERNPWYVRVYNERGEELEIATPNLGISDESKMPITHEIITFHEQGSEDGLTFECYVHLTGEFPEKLALTIGEGLAPRSQEEARTADIVLVLAE